MKRFILTWIVAIAFIIVFLSVGVRADTGFIMDINEIEIAYDDGSSEGGWAIGSGEICSDNGGNWKGYAIRMTIPDSEPFTITAIKLFSRRYGEDCNTRFEIWNPNRDILYSEVVPHSEYSTATDSWDYATWGYKDIPNIVVSGDFYIVIHTDSSDPDDEIYPDTGVYIGYDSSFSSDRSYTVQGKDFTWDLSTPQETTNWMIRVIGIEENDLPVDWKDEWISEDSDGGTAVTTNELQDAIHHWLENIPVREHTMSTGDLQEIIAMWLSG